MNSRILPISPGIPVTRGQLLSAIFGSSLLVESWLDRGVTLGTVPRAQGTSPPVLTYGGVRTGGVFPYIQCDGAGALGVWTYKVSYNDGASFPYTGILSSGTPTALPGPGGAITVSAAAGDASTDNIWQPIAAQVDDISGNANHASESTAANRPLLRAAAFNGKPALDFGVGTTFGLTTPNVSYGPHTILIALRGDASSGYACTHGTVGGASYDYIFCQNTAGSLIFRSGLGTGRNVSATWLSDGARRTVVRSFNGTVATHLLYRNGVADTTSSSVVNNDPGTDALSGPFRIGYDHAKAGSFRGLICGWAVLNRACTAAEAAFLHTYATTIRGFAL